MEIISRQTLQSSQNIRISHALSVAIMKTSFSFSLKNKQKYFKKEK